MEEKWYFKYDEKTFEYTGGYFGEEKPENSTSIEPIGIFGSAKWEQNKNNWVGLKIEAVTNGLTDNSQLNVKTSEELISALAQQLAFSQINQAKTNAILMQQNATLVKQITTLQSEKETSNGWNGNSIF